MPNLIQVIRDFLDQQRIGPPGQRRSPLPAPNPDVTDPDFEFFPIVRELQKQGAISESDKQKAERGERVEVSNNKKTRIERALRNQQDMVTFQEFMSVGLDKCGSDQRTFRRLTDLWNREKEQIQRMTRTELRDELNCP